MQRICLPCWQRYETRSGIRSLFSSDKNGAW